MTTAQTDLLLEAIERHGATIREAAHYAGLSPDAVVERLALDIELQLAVAEARRASIAGRSMAG